MGSRRGHPGESARRQHGTGGGNGAEFDPDDKLFGGDGRAGFQFVEG